MAKERPPLDAETQKLLDRYGEHLNNTGGNDPGELLQDLMHDKNLAITNVVRFTLAACVQSQLTLLATLRGSGLLEDPPAK